jgi:hypothetical protein
VRFRDRVELDFRFRKRDVEAGFAAPYPFKQELERERRLSHARITVDEIKPVARQPAAQDFVEAGNAGRALRGEYRSRHAVLPSCVEGAGTASG